MSHAIDRARDHYGVELTFQDLKNIRAAIRQWGRNVQEVRPGSECYTGRSTLYLVAYAGEWLPVAVAPDGCIVTVCPRHVLAEPEFREAKRVIIARYGGKESLSA